MAQMDVAVSLIQLIALFLPAWAIMIQITVRLLNEVDLSDQPLLMPFFAIGLSTALVSVWVFAGAAIDIISFFIGQELVTESSNLLSAVNRVGIGSLAFLSFGAMVILIAIFKDIEYWDMAHLLGLSVIVTIVAASGWIFRNVWITMIGVLAVFAGDLFYILWREETGGLNLPFGSKKEI